MGVKLALLLLFQRATGTVAPIIEQMLDYKRVTLIHFPGWVTSTALIVSAIGPTALAFVAIVGRARRALDFSATLLVSHVVATTVHSGFPTTIAWWALNLLAAAGLAAVAEAVSLRLELRDIAVPREPKRPPRDDDARPLQGSTDVEAAEGATGSTTDPGSS